MQARAVSGPVPLAALAGAALLAAAGPARSAPDVDALRQRVVAAYGGDAVRSAVGFRERGRILRVANGVSGRVEVSVGLDGSLRSEIRYPDLAEVRILHGPLAWSGGPGRQPLASRDMTDAVRLQYHRIAAPFEIAAAPAEELVPDGESEEGWVRLARRWDDRIRTIYEIDPETGRIRRVHGELTGADGSVLRFDSEAHDFREVSGILFPFRTTTMVDGEITAEIVLDRVTPVKELDSADFRPTDAAGGI